MSEPCDLCGRSIEVGEPRFGGIGDGGKRGSNTGDRHWRCHVDKFGRPGSTSLWADKEPKGSVGLTPAAAP